MQNCEVFFLFLIKIDKIYASEQILWKNSLKNVGLFDLFKNIKNKRSTNFYQFWTIFL